MIIEESAILKEKLKDILENKNFKTKLEEKDVNNGIPFTFTKEDYNTKEGRPIYTDANKFGKSGAAIAMITPNTISRYFSEHIDYPEPVNFEKLVGKNGKKDNKNVGIFEKCHIIGYHLSARFSDFNNIFIGTKKLNHSMMYRIEKSIEDIVVENRKILYKVTPLYMFKMDIVPMGVLFEYESIDKKEKILGCKFCYNVQPNHKINYFDGSNVKIENIQIPEKDEWVEQKNNSIVSSDKTAKNYYLNIKTNVFHLVYDEKEKCEDLKGVAIKFIQEVTGVKEDILKGTEFKICKKCEKKYNDSIIKNKNS